eukprot:11139288-Alexandrium_andersonii.AAC.1
MPRCVSSSPRASARLRLGCPVVFGVRLGHQCVCAWDAPSCVAFASGISASALGMSRCVWRSPRASA